jgi:parallel beta-helix repeat protein
MKRKGIVISLSFVFVLIFIIIIIGLSQKATAYTPHDPIDIEGDADFASQAASEGWAGNGTQEDPYVIEGYEIDLVGGIGGEHYGILIETSDVHFIINNTRVIGENYSSGIYLNYVKNGTIKDCVFENGYRGIYLWDTDRTIISNNTLNSCDLVLWFSANGTFIQNVIVNGGFGYLNSLAEGPDTNNINTSNLVNGKPVYFFKNQNNGVVPDDAGQIILINCTNFNLERRILTNTSIGIILSYSSHNTIKANTIEDCTEAGIDLYRSSENVLIYNQISNCKSGIFFFDSDNNSIEFNNISINSWGIQLVHSNSNHIYGNNASYNLGTGIFCRSSLGQFVNHENSIVNNTITNNSAYGIELISSERTYILGNTISNNFHGIRFSSVDASVIHHNNFINNSFRHFVGELGTNTWRNSRLRGNYWSDYEGRDNTGDGIGDTNLPHQGVDHHPLMEPAQPGDYIESDFSEDETISDPDDAVPCFLSVLLLLIIIIILLIIIGKLRRRATKDTDESKEDEIKEEQTN